MSRVTTVGEALASALADNTRLAYVKGWNRFSVYCRGQGVEPLSATPADVGEFLIHAGTVPRSPRATAEPGAPVSSATLALYRSAINRRYREAGKPSPAHSVEVEAVLKGLARVNGAACRRVRALREFEIERMLRVCDAHAESRARRRIALRDAALLALGFSCALRRSEICGLTVGDIAISDPTDGAEEMKMFVTIRRSKTDQHGRGQRIAVPEGRRIRPIARVRAWLEESGIERGFLFRAVHRGGKLTGRPLHHSDVPRLVKTYAAAIGLDPRDVSGHSLRAGFMTSAAAHRARLDKIMEITRHRNPATVMTYIRDADAFTDHAGSAFL